MAEPTDADRQQALAVAEQSEFRGQTFLVRRIAQALADQRAELTAAYEAGYEGLRADITERIRGARQQAWDEGYQACYKGEQRHNPYRLPRSEVVG